MLVKASAPGSLMLLGEYAVLDGKPALVCALNKRIHATLAVRTDRSIRIVSQLGTLEISIDDLTITKPFQFVTAVLLKFATHYATGFDLTITSEMSDQQGLGSSAAVTVAVLTAVTTWLNLSYSITEFIQLAKTIIHSVQGLGSGADAAACVLGGIVAYQTETAVAEKIADNYPITVIYSGYKTPTSTAVNQVKASFTSSPDQFDSLCQAIGACAGQGIQAVRARDWLALGNVMNQQQQLMQFLGVNTPELREILAVLNAQKNYFRRQNFRLRFR